MFSSRAKHLISPHTNMDVVYSVGAVEWYSAWEIERVLSVAIVVFMFYVLFMEFCPLPTKYSDNESRNKSAT